MLSLLIFLFATSYYFPKWFDNNKKTLLINKETFNSIFKIINL
ncbi:hypothetical protein AM2_1277 [Lactococcus cremoris]|nr:hypothetical protein SK110_1194 [Lactococcus cremoris]KZK53971.1 hypothetical protein AM2_1277 [Lactococcus cremoris]